MAKIYGINGVITGKLGAAVYAVRNGEQISRQYQPVVYNPSTPSQVANRAKLKLMSQLSAVMAPVVAMRREGNVSSRNMFVKTNYRAAGFNNNEATITLTDVKLTRSVVGFPNIAAVREQNNIIARLSGSYEVDVDRVIYAMFVKEPDNTLRFVKSEVAIQAGDDLNWPVTFQIPDAQSNLVIYGYGMRDNSEAAKAMFGNMTTVPAETVASLIVSRTLTETDVTLTETKAVESNPSV